MKICFAVSDTGIGIRSQDVRHAFKAFQQLDGSNTRAFGGTGLGLSICDRLARALGSQIEVASTPGKGSRFSFTVECLLEDTASNTAESATELVHKDVDVLLVEDNPTAQLMAEKLLVKFGCRVSVAADGVEALEQFKHNRFDLIFMDCQMPRMDGFRATEEIRKMENRSRVPILALTANTLPEDRIRAFQSGMDEFITKPVNRQKLLSALNHWAGQEKMH